MASSELTQEQRDRAALLLWNLMGSKGNQANQKQLNKKFSTLRRKAHEDERALYQRSGSLEDDGYDSVILQIREANAESEGCWEFVKKVFELVQNTIFVTVCLCALLVVPAAMISVGVKYLQECPKEPKVPVYLLVGGCFGLLKLLSVLWRQRRVRRYEKSDEFPSGNDDLGGDLVTSKSSAFSDTVLTLFLVAWHVCGNVWVFRIYRPNFRPLLHEPSDWCDETVYLVALYQLLGCYVLLAVVVVFVLALTCCYYSTSQPEHQ